MLKPEWRGFRGGKRPAASGRNDETDGILERPFLPITALFQRWSEALGFFVRDCDEVLRNSSPGCIALFSALEARFTPEARALINWPRAHPDR